jgi:hypothetical protein
VLPDPEESAGWGALGFEDGIHELSVEAPSGALPAANPGLECPGAEEPCIATDTGFPPGAWDARNVPPGRTMRAPTATTINIHHFLP